MIFMPVTEPDHLYFLILTQTNKRFPVRSWVDEHPCTFNVQGMAKRILPSILTLNEPDGSKMLLFHLS